jgi:type I restriction enzyme S subunit
MRGEDFTSDRLLALYDRVAEAKDAIPRLRRFVLDLAVRGKLVKQDPNDEPASELLKRIAKEKAQLIAEGKMTRAKSKPLVKDDNSANPPTGWELVSGNEVFFSRSGNSKLIKGQLHSEPGDNRFAGYSAAGQDVWLDHYEHEGIAVILSAVGARCGKAFLANGRWSAVANTHIVWLMPTITIPAYAMLHLNNEHYWIRSGGAQPFIKVNDTLEQAFPVPPLAEQQRIVATVDELMALCDQLEKARAGREAVRDRLTAATWARLTAPDTDAHTFPTHARFALQTLSTLTTRPDQIKTLRQTILNFALRGKLVEQDPTDEPAAELLKQIARRRKSMLDANYPNPSEARMQKKKQAQQLLPAKLPDLPNGWSWATLQQCSLMVIDCKNKTAPYAKNGIKLVRTTNVRDGALNTIDQRFVSEATYETWSLRAKPELGDILITREAPMGEVCLIPNDEKICLGQRMMLARLVPDTINPSFMFYSLRDPDLMGRVQDKPLGMTVQHLRVGGIETLLVPLPPLSEQSRIVAKVDALMALCDQLEASLTTATITRTRVLEALLHEALEMKVETMEVAE